MAEIPPVLEHAIREFIHQRNPYLLSHPSEAEIQWHDEPTKDVDPNLDEPKERRRWKFIDSADDQDKDGYGVSVAMKIKYSIVDSEGTILKDKKGREERHYILIGLTGGPGE